MSDVPSEMSASESPTVCHDGVCVSSSLQGRKMGVILTDEGEVGGGIIARTRTNETIFRESVPLNEPFPNMPNSAPAITFHNTQLPPQFFSLRTELSVLILLACTEAEQFLAPFTFRTAHIPEVHTTRIALIDPFDLTVGTKQRSDETGNETDPVRSLVLLRALLPESRDLRTGETLVRPAARDVRQRLWPTDEFLHIATLFRRA